MYFFSLLFPYRKQGHVPIVSPAAAAEFYDTKVKGLPFLYDTASFGAAEKDSTFWRFAKNFWD